MRLQAVIERRPSGAKKRDVTKGISTLSHPDSLRAQDYGVITPVSPANFPMSFFDRFRTKWKHPDPAIRAAAVADVTDPSVLESIVDNDADETVRLAAVQALTDQNILARIAAGSSPMALAAVRGLEDRKLLAKVAQAAASAPVRESAVERIDDGVTLHRISTSDTDARVRLKARSRRAGPDPVRDFIRTELAKLRPGATSAPGGTSFRGTLEQVATNLIGDARFRINGWLDHETPGLAAVRTLEEDDATRTSASIPAAAPGSARFLAFKRAESGDAEETSIANAYYEITVWRDDESTYLSCVEERSLKIVADAVEWSRVSNASRHELRGTLHNSASQRTE